MNRAKLIQYLRDYNACSAALDWIDQTLGEPEDLWATCQRGDWMLWLLEVVNYDKRTIRHIACDYAASMLHIYEQVYPNDHRPRNCIAMARRYADGEVAYEELSVVRKDATEAARAASDIAATVAAWTAVFTTHIYPYWDPDPVRQADMIRARVSWADVERAMECIAYKKE